MSLKTDLQRTRREQAGFAVIDAICAALFTANALLTSSAPWGTALWLAGAAIWLYQAAKSNPMLYLAAIKHDLGTGKE